MVARLVFASRMLCMRRGNPDGFSGLLHLAKSARLMTGLLVNYSRNPSFLKEGGGGFLSHKIPPRLPLKKGGVSLHIVTGSSLRVCHCESALFADVAIQKGCLDCFTLQKAQGSQ